MSLKDKVKDYNDKQPSQIRALTIKKLRAIYKTHKITKKKTIKKPMNVDKYPDVYMTELLVELQDNIIKADNEGRIIIQIDESIFNT